MPKCRTTALAFGVVVLAGFLLIPGAGSTASVAGFSPAALAASDPCPGTVLDHNYTGTVEWNGAEPGTSVPLRFSYFAEVTTNKTDGVVLSTVCSALNGTATPNGSGNFTLAIDPVQNTTCIFPGGGEAGTCITTVGPYEAVDVTPLGPVPPGYVPTVVQNGTSFAVDIYSGLASVVLDPGVSPATFSTSAVDELTATPMTGADTPSPLSPVYTWTLSGAGWSFVGKPGGPSANVTAAPDTGIGNLSVVAQVSVQGGTLVTPVASELLLSQATEIGTASMNRTVVDAGEPLGVSIDASGAAGYDYSATIYPGLGVSAIAVPCASAPASAGTVALACTGTVVYPTTGSAPPSVGVSNGASTASWTLPEVTVDPAPSIVMLPGDPVGYVGAALPLEVTAAAGTGTAPYEQACIAAGTAAISCQTTPGPTWTFRPTFPSAGTFTVRGWVLDATGANRSATVDVTVDAPPGVAFAPTGLSISAGTPLSVHAVLTGGALPAETWWNVSGSSAPIATGSVAADGTIAALFDPALVGYETLTVTAVDRLGTAFAASITFSVGPGVATSVAPSGLPVPPSVPAGTSVGVEWHALDAVGILVPAFASLGTIELALPGSGDAAAGWVNASGYGPLPSSVAGWFTVPAAAWADGALNVSVTARTAGQVHVDLTLANGFSTADDPVAVLFGPDLDHLRLSEPATARTDPSASDTLWQVSDRFGNPATGAVVVTTSSFGGRVSEMLSTAFVESGGATGAWVNYTVPGGEGGTVTVTDAAGQALLPTVVVPAPTSVWASVVPILPFAALAGAAVVLTLAAYRARRRAGRSGRSAADPATSLQALAEGRATIVEVVRRQGPIDLAGIATVWRTTPAPDALADWIASLLTDGTLDATFGDDGVARFVLSEPATSGTRIVVDVAEFDRGEEAREAARNEWEANDER